jgi:CBS domain-containing protein
MSSPLVTCEPSTRLGEAAALLVRHRIHALVVVDDCGDAVGIVSDTDLLAGEWLATDPKSLDVMRALAVETVMSSPPLTIDADASLADAARRLRSERVARVVVVDDGEPAGILSVSDLVRHLARGPQGRATVADVMSRAFVVCRTGTRLPDAARAMTERRSRSLVIVDGVGQPLGVVTGFDLLSAVEEGGVSALTVDELMHVPVTIGPSESLQAAADRMLEHEIHRLLVVDDGAPDSMPLGLISTSDLLDEMAEPGSPWRD